jgi:hypothetical protein
MYKEDEELLARVAKEKPELLEVDVEEEYFHTVVNKLIKTPPVPKNARNRQRLTGQGRARKPQSR